MQKCKFAPLFYHTQTTTHHPFFAKTIGGIMGLLRLTMLNTYTKLGPIGLRGTFDLIVGPPHALHLSMCLRLFTHE